MVEEDMNDTVAVGDRVSIPCPRDFDAVEVIALADGWFEWRSLSRDASGTFPFKRLSKVIHLCEHINDEQICLECE